MQYEEYKEKLISILNVFDCLYAYYNLYISIITHMKSSYVKDSAASKKYF